MNALSLQWIRMEVRAMSATSRDDNEKRVSLIYVRSRRGNFNDCNKAQSCTLQNKSRPMWRDAYVKTDRPHVCSVSNPVYLAEARQIASCSAVDTGHASYDARATSLCHLFFQHVYSTNELAKKMHVKGRND